jgi:ComF family protein
MSLLDIIFPKSCLECRRGGKYICTACMSKVVRLKPVCPYCEKLSIDGFTHTRCNKKLGLDGLTAVWKYEGVAKKAILSLKYKFATEIVQELCGYYVPELKKYLVTRSNLLSMVPIPIYWHRQNTRGFNQSELLGKEVSKSMGWGFKPNWLYRNKPTPSQTGLSYADRKKNLKGVFSVLPPNSSFTIPDSVILFDDVFTTGSTLHEACKVLKRVGVQKVWGTTIAR